MRCAVAHTSSAHYDQWGIFEETGEQTTVTRHHHCDLRRVCARACGRWRGGTFSMRGQVAAMMRVRTAAPTGSALPSPRNVVCKECNQFVSCNTGTVLMLWNRSKGRSNALYRGRKIAHNNSYPLATQEHKKSAGQQRLLPHSCKTHRKFRT